jgi:hypothetical protein
MNRKLTAESDTSILYEQDESNEQDLCGEAQFITSGGFSFHWKVEMRQLHMRNQSAVFRCRTVNCRLGSIILQTRFEFWDYLYFTAHSLMELSPS